MDPEVVLDRLREWVKSVPDSDEEYAAMRDFEHLDEWLSKGGFPPEAWNR